MTMAIECVFFINIVEYVFTDTMFKKYTNLTSSDQNKSIKLRISFSLGKSCIDIFSYQKQMDNMLSTSTIFLWQSFSVH